MIDTMMALTLLGLLVILIALGSPRLFGSRKRGVLVGMAMAIIGFLGFGASVEAQREEGAMPPVAQSVPAAPSSPDPAPVVAPAPTAPTAPPPRPTTARVPRGFAFDLRAFPDRFNDTARRSRETVRAVERNCDQLGTTATRTCRFSLGNGVEVVGSAMPDGQELRGVTMVVSIEGKGAGPRAAIAINTLLNLLEPRADQAERNTLISALFSSAIDSGNSEMRLRGLQTGVVLLPSMAAAMMTITPSQD